MNRIVDGIVETTALLALYRHAGDEITHVDHVAKLAELLAYFDTLEEVLGLLVQLVQWGVNFDKQQDGKFDLHREGGHSEFRILHHADDTGAEIQRGLMEAVRSNPDIDIKENHFAVEIITQHHLGARVTRRTPYINCYGAYVLNPETQKVDTYLSKVTVMCLLSSSLPLTLPAPIFYFGECCILFL